MTIDINHLDKNKNIHFVGVKGVGMTALARVAKERGFLVSGSDTTIESITNQPLLDAGVRVFNSFASSNIPSQTGLVIYTAAHDGQNNPEVIAAALNKVPTMNYGQALDYFFSNKKIIAVSGTHGKTTTTAMLATILKEANLDPSWIIGTGKISTLGSSGHYGQGDYAIIEADEYFDQPGGKPKFLHLNPYGLIIISLDWDHPDVFSTQKEFVNAFHKLLKRVDSNGILVLLGVNKDLRRLTRCVNQKVRWVLPKKNWPNLKLNIPGEFNRLNATFAATMAHELGVSQKHILRSLASFKGVERRLEVKGHKYGWLVFDDYAHHPNEIKAAIAAVKEKYPDSHLTVAFQSHTFTRTQAFLKDFAQSFGLADCVLIAPIFPSARELRPEENVELFELVSQSHPNAKEIQSAQELDDYLQSGINLGESKIILTMGAGDIYQWIKTD